MDTKPLALALVFAFTAGSALPVAASGVILCHIPPGNPENRQEIVVDASAIAAHLAHGDFLGPCTY